MRISPSSILLQGGIVCYEGTKTWNVVHGAAEQREVTLLDCVLTRGELPSPVQSPETQMLTARVAIIGAHVSGEDDAVFVAAEASVEDLAVWAALPVLGETFGTSDGNNNGRGTSSVKPGEAQMATVGGTEYRLVHDRATSIIDQRKSGTIPRKYDTVFIRIRPTEPFPLSDALKAVKLVQDLIALATHRATGVIWLRLEVAGTEWPRRCADVLYSPVVLGKHDTKAVERSAVFFTCETLPFKQVVPRWCETYGRLQAAVNMILGLRYVPALFIENNFLTAVGTAEVLHRGLRIDKKPFPVKEFEVMHDAMLDQVPEEHRDRFKASIRNDPTLRDRLRVLAGRPDREAVAQLVPDVECWAKRTTRARNDLAHEGKTPNHSIDELIAIVDTTTAIVVLNILSEIGLPAERQRQIVREHPKLRKVSRKALKWLVAPESNS